MLLQDNFYEHFGPRSESNFVESDTVRNVGKVLSSLIQFATLVKFKNDLFELKKLS